MALAIGYDNIHSIFFLEKSSVTALAKKKITSLFYSSCVFAREPLVALVDGFKALRSWKFSIPLDLPAFRLVKRNAVAEKIKDLIFLCNLKPSQIVVGELDTGTDCCVTGSVKNGQKAFLLMTSKLIERINKDFDYNWPLHYKIAHELGHLFADDAGVGRLKLLSIKSAIRVIVYGATCIGLHAFCPIGIIATHLVGCGTAQVAGFVFTYRFLRMQELAADFFSVNICEAFLDGGIEAIKEMQKSNLDKRTELIQEITDSGETLPCCIRGITRRVETCFLSISERGEYRWDFEHPSLATRLKKMEQLRRRKYTNFKKGLKHA